MSKIWAIIPAAGQSRRFVEAGYIIPKPFLSLKSKDGITRSMIGHVIHNLPGHLRNNLLIGISSQWDKPEDLKQDFSFIRIYNSKGQADTIYQMLNYLKEDDSIIIIDCDMILYKEDIEKLINILTVYDVAIAVSVTFDPNSSRVDHVPFPTRFVEKQPISEWGIVGARAFKRVGLLKEAINGILEDHYRMQIEPYLSVAINYYPGIKYAHVITDYVDLGTPERVKEAGWTIL